uniref:ATP synthase subunit b n=1 Tax=Cyanoderma ruficeps TaxID=181631 RepID=A0A8C3QW31_9PASS
MQGIPIAYRSRRPPGYPCQPASTGRRSPPRSARRRCRNPRWGRAGAPRTPTASRSSSARSARRRPAAGPRLRERHEGRRGEKRGEPPGSARGSRAPPGPPRRRPATCAVVRALQVPLHAGGRVGRDVPLGGGLGRGILIQRGRGRRGVGRGGRRGRLGQRQRRRQRLLHGGGGGAGGAPHVSPAAASSRESARPPPALPALSREPRRHLSARRRRSPDGTRAATAAPHGLSPPCPVVLSCHALPPRPARRVMHTTRPLHTTQQSLAPLPPLPEKGGEVRHGLIPEEFFQFLYPKTGVTGPYMLGTGLLLYFLSKEIYVVNHETAAAACILTVIIYGIKKFGGNVAAFADRLNEEKLAAVSALKNESIQALQTAIEEEKKEQWRVEGRTYLFDAKRNNIAMLLETNYRERLLMVYNEVKKRLDYQVAMQTLKRQKEQEHMIQWVEKNVVQSITPQQQKESIAKCILDLKALSKSVHAAV